MTQTLRRTDNIASIRTRQEKLTKEEVEKFIDEMTARKRNVERLRLKIRPKEDMQI